MTTGRDIAAIVFTDMVASTALRSRLGEERADRLRRIHDQLLTARVQANQGRVLRYQGDGLVAMFSAASDALTAAVEIQQAAASYSRRRDALAEIELRVGVSVGEVSFEDGDCFGIPMVEAARLEAAAGAGQILCSDLTRVMARGRGGHSFRSIGFLELKGLPEPLAACQVTWEAEPDEAPFPLPAELATEGARPFVGRAAEVETAEILVKDARRTRLSVLWLLGEPGIGKTRLAAEIAGRAHAEGGVVLFGRCSEDVALPYQPFLEALRWYVPLVPDSELADRLGDAPEELLRLNPRIGARLPLLKASRASPAETGQFRLFESVRTWLASAGGGRPVAVVLDDLHWAARPTLAMLGHVARSAEPSPTLLVCTVRNTAPDSNPALWALIEELGRRGTPSRQIELGGLSPQALAELLQAVTGRSVDTGLSALADRLWDETAGNPLYADALIRALEDPAYGAGATTLSTTLDQRVARLPSETAEVLRGAAIIGLEFDIPVLAQAVQLDEMAVLDSLETASFAGLIAEQAANSYRFRHALVRAALQGQTSESRRVRMHLRVADALEDVHRSNLAEHAAALAYHLLEALSLGTAQRAFGYLLRSAEHAVTMLSYDEAVEAYGKALELLESVEGTAAAERFRLLSARGAAQRRAGDMIGALGTLRSAADEAARRGLLEEMAGAAVAFEETLFWLGRPGDEALDLVERATGALPPDDSPLRALTLATMSRTLATSGRETGDWPHQALAMAERLGDPPTSFRVAFRTTESATSVQQAETSAASWSQLCAGAKEVGEEDAYLLGLGQLFWAQAMLGEVSGADELIADYDRLAGQLRQSRWDYWLNLMRAFRASLAADLVSAEQFLEVAEDVGEGFGWAREGLYGISMFLLRREQGRWPDVAPLVRAASALDSQNTLWRPGLAALYIETGSPDLARSEYEAVLSQWASGMPADSSFELSLGLVAEVCAALGDGERARWLIDLLRPCRGRFLTFLGCAAGLGPTDRLLGMLASAAGRPEDAERWHRSGLELARRMASPLWIAHCLHDYGEYQIQYGMPTGFDLLREASLVCEAKGLLVLGSRVERALQGTRPNL